MEKKLAITVIILTTIINAFFCLHVGNDVIDKWLFDKTTVSFYFYPNGKIESKAEILKKIEKFSNEKHIEVAQYSFLNSSNYRKGKWNKKDINEVMEKVGLPLTYLNKKVYQLSGGEQQKVAIARMMLKQYEIVLADEPTGNLDYKNKIEIIKIFKDIQKNGKTIICVTHDREVAEAADRIINLSRI